MLLTSLLIIALLLPLFLLFTPTTSNKLYFRHGPVSSAKTLNLLSVAHSYRSQNKTVLLLKPSLDTRFGNATIKSRSGLEKTADFMIEDTTDLLVDLQKPKELHCILVDEVQFLSPHHISQLRHITSLWSVPIICYGLRTDFRTRLFPGSKRLLELADNIEEIKTTCYGCNRKALFNLKHVDGVAVVDGPSVQLGCEESYFPTCFTCYKKALTQADTEFPSD